MRSRSDEYAVRAEVIQLKDVRQRIRTEVFTRYTTLKTQGRTEEEARNVAVVWTAQRYPQWSRDTVRRELEVALSPPSKHPRNRTPPSPWSLPT